MKGQTAAAAHEGNEVAAEPRTAGAHDASAAHIADAMVATWCEIDLALTPIIGSNAVMALYERSLDLTARIHPWLAGKHEASLGSRAVLQTFARLLGSLIGPSLSERSLSAWVAAPWQPADTQPLHQFAEIGAELRRTLSFAMNSPADPSTAANARSELAALRHKVDQARAQLTRVRLDVLAAEDHFGSRQAAQILEANEQLVLAALRAQTQADTAAEAAAAALKETSRSAELDALTGLPNRVLLRDRLAQAISSAKRRDTRSALLFLDLNNFKQINDALGHAVGDQVLRVAATRLASSVRAADTVSRHGGDEFLILLAEVGQVGDAVAIADKAGAALDSPSRVCGREVRLTASIGISLYPDDGEDADMLIEVGSPGTELEFAL